MDKLDLTPTWEATAKILLEIIQNGTDPANVRWATAEVVRMGQIIDQLKPTN